MVRRTYLSKAELFSTSDTLSIGYTMGTEGLAIYLPEGGARRW